MLEVIGAGMCAPTVGALKQLKDGMVFMYDKEEGVLHEVEADVWARLVEGTKLKIQRDVNRVECTDELQEVGG